MAKVTGLGATVIIDDSAGSPQTISNDVTNFQFSTPFAVQDTTGVDKFAHERLLLLADYSATFNGVFNTASSHVVFATIPSTRVIRTVKIQPISGATPFMTAETLLTDYALTRSNTGELTWSVPAVLADGTAPSWS
jgi:hypothetical protein